MVGFGGTSHKIVDSTCGTFLTASSPSWCKINLSTLFWIVHEKFKGHIGENKQLSQSIHTWKNVDQYNLLIAFSFQFQVSSTRKAKDEVLLPTLENDFWAFLLIGSACSNPTPNVNSSNWCLFISSRWIMKQWAHVQKFDFFPPTPQIKVFGGGIPFWWLLEVQGFSIKLVQWHKKIKKIKRMSMVPLILLFHFPFFVVHELTKSKITTVVIILITHMILFV